MSTGQQGLSAKASDLGGAESRGSLTPLLPGSFPSSTKSSTEPGSVDTSAQSTGNESKSSKRSFWKLGKKTDEDKSKGKGQVPKAAATYITPAAALRPASPLRSEIRQPSASSQQSHPYGTPASPSAGLFSSSPRLHSPASSQIFERNVQEEALQAQASPHLPSHIITENHIPPALDASTDAITNQRLDPDDVEIVTSSTHQPAAVTITGTGPEHLTSSSFQDDFSHHRHTMHDDNASNYGTLDSADVRRLSFVSFADVVHAEHAEHTDSMGDAASHRGSMQSPGFAGVPSLSAPRSPSPIRSPVSSHGFGTSPPTSVSPSFKGLESSPSRGVRAAGSPPPTQSPPLGGDLNVETMRQALRKTGSGDLSGVRSQPMSAVGGDDGTFTDRPFK